MDSLLDFPRNPHIGSTAIGPGGVRWVWDGQKWTAGGGTGAWMGGGVPGFPDAPFDSRAYARFNGNWVPVLVGDCDGNFVLNGDVRMGNNSSIIIDYPTPCNLMPSVLAPNISANNFWLNSFNNGVNTGEYLTTGGAGNITVDVNGNMVFSVVPNGAANTTFNAWTGTFSLQSDNRVNIGNYWNTNIPLLVGTNTGYRAGARFRIANPMTSAVQGDYTIDVDPTGTFNLYQSNTPSVAFSYDSGNITNVPQQGIRYSAYSTTNIFADSWDGTFIHFLVNGTDLGQFPPLTYISQNFLSTAGGTITGGLNVNGAVNVGQAATIAGNLQVDGTINTNTSPLMVGGTGSNFYLFYTAASEDGLNFAPNYDLTYAMSTGVLSYNVPAGSLWVMDPTTNEVYNNLGPVGGVGAYFTVSDLELKKNVNKYTRGLKEIRQLQPITFDWRKGNLPGEVGFDAQSVINIFPEAEYRHKVGNKEYGGYRDAAIIGGLVNAVHEMANRIEKLERGK